MQQNAYSEIDASASLNKQYKMLKTVLKYYDRMIDALDLGVQLKTITGMKVRTSIARMKEVPEKEFNKKVEEINSEIDAEFDRIVKSAKKEVAA